MTGTVYEAIHRTTGERYALKCMERKKITADLLSDLRNEVTLLQTVRCALADALASRPTHGRLLTPSTHRSWTTPTSSSCQSFTRTT